MPYITEEIWDHLPSSGKALIVASWPRVQKEWKDEELERRMEIVQKAIVEIRTLRAENRIPPKKSIDLQIKLCDTAKGKDEVAILNNPQSQRYIQTLANIREIETVKQFQMDKTLLKGVVGDLEIAIPLEEGLIDFNQEKKRIERELTKIEKEVEKIKRRLQNTDFLSHAPLPVIEKTKGRLRELNNRKTKLEESLEHILSLV
jgi:valyl-tRNA synthetase